MSAVGLGGAVAAGQEIAVTIRAVNRASREFVAIARDSAKMGREIAVVGAQISGLGASVAVIGQLGHQFGVLDDQTNKWFYTVGNTLTALGSFVKILQWATSVQNAHTAASAVGATVQTTLTGATIASAGSHGIYAIAAGIAAKAQAWFNAHLAAGLVLTGVGITLVIAAAAAFAVFAAQVNAAASAQTNLNAAISATPTHSLREIRRAGEEDLWAWLRRREEDELVSRRHRVEELERYRRGVEEP